MSRKTARLDEASSSTSYAEKMESKMSDSVFKLYEPNPPQSANLDIFFFHGLQLEGASDDAAYLSTWTSEDGQKVWPRCWLPREYPRARIISISYDACIETSDTGGRMDLFMIGESLMWEITHARKGRGHVRPLILVGHSFGGLVIKQLCVHSQKNGGNREGGREMIQFLDSIRGIFFYSTPHHGMNKMELRLDNEGPLFRLVRDLNGEAARLHEDFIKVGIEKSYQWTIYGLGETHSTSGQGDPLVPEASSRFGVYMIVISDHSSVCRPVDKNDNKYLHLIKLIEIVNRQLKVQDETKPPQMVPKVIVGVESIVTELVEIHLRDHTLLGLCGMGGIGKTTLAKLIFNKLYANFEVTCFVEGMKFLHGNIDEIEQKIWENMRCGGDADSLAGANGVRGRSVLCIFDDISSDDHVKLVSKIVYGCGEEKSRFIVTTRDSTLLQFLELDKHIHQVGLLELEDARRLFVKDAFPTQEDCPEQFKEVTEEIVQGCAGLPRTLEVLGTYLGANRKMEIWSQMPSALRECDNIDILEERLWSKLQLSYDDLGEVEQNIFLDIATCWADRWSYHFTYADIMMAWSSMYKNIHIRLQTLVNKFFIYEVETRWPFQSGWSTPAFSMNEQLKRMGERIARKMGRICYWSPGSKFAISLLNEQPYRCEIKSFGKGPSEPCWFCTGRRFLPMTTIHYMQWHMMSCMQCRSIGSILPTSLLLLHIAVPLTSGFTLHRINCKALVSLTVNGVQLPSNVLVGLSKLEALVVRYCVVHDDRKSQLQQLQQLRHLTIAHSTIPNNWVEAFGKLTKLERVRLEYVLLEGRFLTICKNALKKLHFHGRRQPLPITFGNSTQLETLVIDCWEWEILPSVFGNLTQLKHLELRNARSLVLTSFGNLTRLEHLEIIDCGVDVLPSSFGNLTRLDTLVLLHGGIVKLPYTFGNLRDLRHLDLDSPVEEISVTLANFPSLKWLHMKGWKAEAVINFMRLEKFDINLDGHAKGDSTEILQKLPWVEELPESLGELPSLTQLTIAQCKDLQTLTDLIGQHSELEKLEVLDCESLKSLPDTFGNLSKLYHLSLEGCSYLQFLPDTLGKMPSLESLYLDGCSSLQSLPDTLGNLRFIGLKGCSSLQYLPDTLRNVRRMR